MQNRTHFIISPEPRLLLMYPRVKGKTHWLILVFSALMFLLACGEKTISPDDNRLGLEYYPLETGQYRIYDVDEILYSISSFDTLQYQLRESVVNAFENAEGTTTYTIHREKRNNDQDQWELDSVWTARKTSTLAISVENNVSLIKMVFPINNGLSWDSNKFNQSGEKRFSYDLNLADTTLANEKMTDLVKVIQSEIEENIVNRDERYEIFAPNVGLIVKHGIRLSFCTVDCPVQKTIESGRFIQQTLFSYGKE